MSEVKRLSLDLEYPFQYREDAEGNLCYYADYAALKAECESNAKSAQYSVETNRKISRKNGEMHDEILSLKAERDALAAENNVLESVIGVIADAVTVLNAQTLTAKLRKG